MTTTTPEARKSNVGNTISWLIVAALLALVLFATWQPTIRPALRDLLAEPRTSVSSPPAAAQPAPRPYVPQAPVVPTVAPAAPTPEPPAPVAAPVVAAPMERSIERVDARKQWDARATGQTDVAAPAPLSADAQAAVDHAAARAGAIFGDK